MTSKDIEEINKLTAGHSCYEVDVVSFKLPCSAFRALEVLDHEFDMTTTQVVAPGEELHVWRVLETSCMKLRFQFNSTRGSRRNHVDVYGFKAGKRQDSVHFTGPLADKCFSHFVCRIVPFSKSHLTAVAMGQHDRLGAGSRLFTLPDGVLQQLMQPLLTTLAHWDWDKERALQASIKLQKLEMTMFYIDKLVASEAAYDGADEGIFFEGNFNCPPYNMDEMCARLDVQFGVSTEELNLGHIFFAKRLLRINDKNVLFHFEHDRHEGPSFIRVKGLGRVERWWTPDFSPPAYIYLLDALLRSGQPAVLTVTTDE
jgi:hypothetical protein